MTCLPGAWGQDHAFEGCTSVTVVGTSHISNTGDLDPRNAPTRHLSGSELEAIAMEGDLLVVKSSGSASNIRSGKTALCPRHLSGKIAAANFLMRLVPNRALVSPYLLWLHLNSPDAKAFVRKIAGSSTYPNIKWSEFKALSIPLPPLAEQERIAGRLTEQLAAMERARGAAKERLAAAESLPAAYLREVFEGPEAIGWETRRLSSVLRDTRNGLYKPDTFYGSGVPILKMYNIGRFDGRWYLDRLDMIRLEPTEHALYRLEPGDIIINRVNSRELVGKSAVVDERLSGAVFESKNIRARVDTSTDPQYFAYWLNSAFARRQIESRIKQIVGQATLNRDDLDGLEMPSPSHADQRRIAADLAARLAGAERLALGIRAELAAIESLPAALLREAFSPLN